MTAVARLSVSASAVPADDAPMSDAETQDLSRREKRMRVNYASAQTFYEDMKAIRDGKLYRANHPSFAKYLEERWQMSAPSAYRAICHHETVAAIATPDADGNVFKILPESERVTRPLHKLDDAEKKEAWSKASAAAGGRPTLEDVEAAAVAVAPEKSHKKPVKDVDSAIAAGIIPANAVVEVSGGDDETVSADTTIVPADLTDAEWLDRTEIRAVRDKLSPLVRERFDMEAILFRQLTPARLAFRAAAKPKFEALKRESKGHIGPWMARYYGFMRTNDPSRWAPCSDCTGTGTMTLLGECPACKGKGYHV